MLFVATDWQLCKLDVIICSVSFSYVKYKYKHKININIKYYARAHIDRYFTCNARIWTALGALRSQLTFRLACCRDTVSSYGDRTFAAAGPRLWNSLPVQLRNPDISHGLFRWQLEGRLFREAWTRRSATSDMRRLRKTLTYLLTYLLWLVDPCKK